MISDWVLALVFVCDEWKLRSGSTWPSNIPVHDGNICLNMGHVSPVRVVRTYSIRLKPEALSM